MKAEIRSYRNQDWIRFYGFKRERFIYVISFRSESADAENKRHDRNTLSWSLQAIVSRISPLKCWISKKLSHDCTLMIHLFLIYSFSVLPVHLDPYLVPVYNSISYDCSCVYIFCSFPSVGAPIPIHMNTALLLILQLSPGI